MNPVLSASSMLVYSFGMFDMTPLFDLGEFCAHSKLPAGGRVFPDTDRSLNLRVSDERVRSFKGPEHGKQQ
jgi:hypothetical protein